MIRMIEKPRAAGLGLRTDTHTLQFYLSIIIEYRVFAKHIQTFQQCSVSTTTKTAKIKLKKTKSRAEFDAPPPPSFEWVSCINTQQAN